MILEKGSKAGYEYLLAYKIKEKHMKEGGLTEELYRKRKEYRGY